MAPGAPERRGSAAAAIGTASAAPFGYTLTIWGSGALLIHFRGTPGVANVFLFIAGALAGFSFFGLAAGRLLERRGALDDARARLLAGLVGWLAAGVALGGTALVAQVRGGVAWPLAALVSTVLYLALESLQLGLAARALGVGEEYGGVDE